ncbi:MAG: D-alanyl-D-alanine carboxypeptidase [Clostridia bacterium]|nr:D-alanyl-D-alanine carboxypeptidase [Clostridia bacterium]
MKIKFKIMLSILICCLIFTGVGFNAVSINSVEAVSTSAKGMCVLEQDSKRVLYQKDMDKMLANASTTKIVTAITVIQNCDNLDEIITVHNKSIGIEGTSIYLRKDEQISVRDLLYGLMLRSGNDSAMALAYHVGGTEEKFVDMMNELCVTAGAKNSHFANPHGLDETDHYTTAYDLAMVTAYALNNPIFADIVSTKHHTIPATNISEARYLTNKNRLLNSLDGCIGVKTGFTTRAGRCLVSAIKRNGITLVCVVLNCGPMFEESVTLLNSAYSEYDFSPITIKDEPIYNEYYIDSERGQLNLYTDETYIFPIKNSERNKLKVVYSLYELTKNVEENEEVGEISVFYDNHLQKTLKLYTINKIDVLVNQDIFNSIKLQWEK